ncbi:hypothetical protein JCM10295v2_000825 [Rhodotorula toruloides]
MPKRALDLFTSSSDSSDSSYTPPGGRTRLLGGAGTGLEDKPKSTPEEGAGEKRGEEQDEGESQGNLEFAKGRVLVTTYVKEKRGRPRTKGKGKGKARKKRQDASSETSSSSTDETDDGSTRVDLDTIFGTDFDKHVLRALVMSPRMQVPTTLHRFATTRENKPRESKKGEGDTSDDHESPLLLLHDEADTSDWQAWTSAIVHQSHGGVGNGKKDRMEAKLLMVRRIPPSQRHSLRIAIHTSKMDADT